MSTLPQRIEWATRIRNHAPGWQNDWNMLAEELYEPLKRRVADIFRRRPDGENERDDFVAGVLLKYTIWAHDGSLFAGWTPDWDPLQYLSGSIVRGWAFDYLRALNRIRNQQNDYATTHARVTGGRTLQSSSTPLVPSYLSFRIRLKLGTKKRLASPMVQGGMQLYPSLDDTMPRYTDLETAVQYAIIPPAKWYERLMKSHHWRRVAMEKKLEKYAKQVVDDQGNILKISPRKRQRINGKMDKCRFELCFIPFDAETLMDLMEIKRNHADVKRKEYKRALPELLDM